MKPEDYIKETNKFQFIRNYLENDKRLIRLFAVACCYQIWDLITDKQNQKAVEVAELYADGLATEEQRQQAAAFSFAAYASSSTSAAYYASASAASAAYAAAYAASAAYAAASSTYAAYANIRDEIYLKQSFMLKNMKGNWDNSWNTSDVTSLSKTIYDKKQYGLMPILSDALQEAGCQDERILNYCKGGDYYFRGCWVLDKATGKR